MEALELPGKVMTLWVLEEARVCSGWAPPSGLGADPQNRALLLAASLAHP